MRDNLENFINDNRESFDDKVPSLKVWADIEKRLDPPKAKRISILRMVSVAASVVFLLAVGAWGGKYILSNDGNPVATDLEKISPEYAKMEEDFQIRINQKKAQLASYNYDMSVNEDLTDLDETLEELRKELKNVPKGSEEQIVEAMIKNYETKIAILEIVLKKINVNTKRGQQNEGNEM